MMNIHEALERALEKGEKIKEQLLVEVMNSNAVNELLQNETFIKSLTKVLNTKYEITRAFKSNIHSLLKGINVPTRDEVKSLNRKIDRLEREFSDIHRKVLTDRLKKKTAANSKKKKAVRKKKKTSARKKTRAKTTKRRTKR